MMKANKVANKRNAPREAEASGTVPKALGLLDRVADFGRPVRFSELQAVSGMPKATTARLLQTLTAEGMLSYDADRRVYLMGTRLIRLAQVAWRDFSLAPVARPHLHALAKRVGEAAYLSKLDCGQCVCLDRGAPDDLRAVFQGTGRVYPSYCTAVGKAMLAFLPQDELARALIHQSFHPMTENTITDADIFLEELHIVRNRGFAVENEEHVRGILAIAVPVLSPGGALLGGLGIHAPDRRTDLEALRALVPELGKAAVAIARDAAETRYPEPQTRSG